jgi:uncharacterized protein
VSTVFVDSSGWIALLSADDRFHDRAVSRYDELSAEGARLLTSNYVVDETATVLRYGLGLPSALAFRRTLIAGVTARRLRVVWVDEQSEAAGWDLLERYADVTLSLTDAVNAVTARNARITEVFGCDADFEALGFTVLPGSR